MSYPQRPTSGYRYANKVKIGYVDTVAPHPALHKHGDTKWGIHEWVMQAADALQKVEGFQVESHISIQWIKDKFEEKEALGSESGGGKGAGEGTGLIPVRINT